MLKIDAKKIAAEVKKRKARLVLLQLPEGLKEKATGLAEAVEKGSKAKAIVLLDPCFGACDLAEEKAKALGADLIVHFGHSAFFKPEKETVFVPLNYELGKAKIGLLAEKISKKLNENSVKKIALVSTIQFADLLPIAKKLLKAKGISAFIEGNGAVLGCRHENALKAARKAEAIVFVGDGLFHPLGVAFASKKPVFAANPFSLEVKGLEKEKELFERARIARIALAGKAKSFGIIVSTKKGQMQMENALKLKELLERKGKKAFILAMDLVKPDYFLGVKADCLVNTACPRIVLDDAKNFGRLIVEADDARKAFL
ncbi:MAG: diphthamide biosynthesis enzyme Dph2 [Candidatus Diapherotrites archaeon]